MRPNATITLSDAFLTAGETSEVTITFSEAVTGFGLGALSIPNGAIQALVSSDGGVTWRGILTPTENVRDASNLITLNNAAYTDLAGNAGIGTTSFSNYVIDTVRPTASVVVADTDETNVPMARAFAAVGWPVTETRVDFVLTAP